MTALPRSCAARRRPRPREPMCGIAGEPGRSRAVGADEAAVRAMSARARAPRARRRGAPRRRPVRARQSPAGDHRPRPWRPADGQRGRPVQVVQNGEMFNHARAPRRARARRALLRAPTATRRCCRTSTSSAGRASSSGCAACSPSRSGTRARGALLLARDPLWDQAAVLARRGRRAVLRLRAQGARCGPARRPRGSTSRRSRPISPSTRSPAPARSTPACASCRRGTCSSPAPGAARCASSALRGRRPCARPRCARRPAARWRASCARACATASAPTSSRTCRSASSSPAASTRRSLATLAAQVGTGAVRTFSIGFEERSFDELDRARARRATRSAPTTASSSCARTPRSCSPEVVAAFDEPFADSSALPTYAGVAAGRRPRQGGAVGRGRRRAVRRLLHVRRRSCSPRGWRRWRAVVRPAVEALPSSERRVSLDYKAKRFVRAAGLPPLERHHGWKEIFSADARAALLEPGPPRERRRARRLARALRRDGGLRAARAPAGRRPRDLPRRRPAGEDRSCVDGALARGRACRSSTRPSPSWRSRCRPGRRSRMLQKKRLLRRAAARVLPSCDRLRPQAWLLDPGRGVAARPAASDGPRPPRPRRRRAPGLLPPRRGRPSPRRARERAGGPLAPTVGAAVLRAVGAADGVVITSGAPPPAAQDRRAQGAQTLLGSLTPGSSCQCLGTGRCRRVASDAARRRQAVARSRRCS